MLLIPARAGDLDAEALPPDYQRILAIVREAAGPVKIKQVGEVLGLPVEVRGTGAAAREADQARRSWLAALASR
ncbi:hypothetical protein [Catenulispora sp. GP43]|uniref:hypothetical protein n=1 Tax=Catenulispora sp. GP43 TaxID=3156263 RepID=UPI003515053A